MKKYDENDIINMLSKTEKTTPDFDKKVVFPSKAPLIIRRRKIRMVLIAACVSVMLFTVIPILLIANRGNVQTSMPENYSSENIFVSGVSYYPIESNEESIDYSSDNSFEPDESRVPHGSMTDDSSLSSCSEDESTLPLIKYPIDSEFYNGQGMSKGSTPEEFIKTNPHNHLGARIKLPVYSKKSVTMNDFEALNDALSKAVGNEFALDENYNVNLGFSGKSSLGNTFTLSKYGDWECSINDNSFMNIIIEKGNPEALLGAIERFVIINPEIFGEGERHLECDIKANFVRVKLIIKTDDKILSELAGYTFEFERSGSNCILKRFTHKAGNAKDIGEYQIRLYDSAVKLLFEERFIGENEFEFSDDDEFVISAYDVRYLQSSSEAMICPYYVFVIEVGPYSGNSRYETVFIPAIIDDYIENYQVD